MDKISLYLLQDILYFLDFQSIQECRGVCKKFNSLIGQSFFWKSKNNKANPSSFFSGPYFKFPDPLLVVEKIHSEIGEVDGCVQVGRMLKRIMDPQKLEIQSIEASSEDHDQTADCVLIYNDRFWSSLPNDSSDTDEHLLVELMEESYIFTVSFYVYRAVYQGGTVYPPKSAKIFIGNSKDNFHYESSEYPIELSENCNTILILPEIVKGKFIKLLLIGKQMRENGTEKWYTVLRYIEISGHCSKPDPDLSLCKSGDFLDSSFIHEVCPFYMERMEKFGTIEKFLSTVSYNNDIILYFSRLYPQNNQTFRFAHSELIGNYLMQKKEYKEAKLNYMRIGDVWGYCRACMKLGEYKEIARLIDETNVRLPKMSWVLETATQLGGEELKVSIKEYLDNLIGEE